jgi:endonuclease/exonuclease/phosphatase family metal-dependent hydrolase
MLRILAVALVLLTFSAQAADLTVATFNTESDDDTTPAKVAETIGEIGAFDLLAVQEVESTAALKTYTDAAAAADVQGGRWRYVVSESGTYSDPTRKPDLLGIIYRTGTFRQLATTELHLIRSRPDGTQYGEPDWALRGALVLRLQHIATGVEFQIITLHLKCCGEGIDIRAHQSALLADWILAQGLPTILLGDSNIPIEPGDSGPTGGNVAAFDKLTASSGLTWIAPMDPVKTQCDPQYNSMLDQVYVSNAATGGASVDVLFDDASYCANDELGYSDHRPVVATLPAFLIGEVAAPASDEEDAAIEEREFLLQRSGRPEDSVAQ